MGTDFQVGASTDEVLDQCLSELEPEKYCLCLMVLKEAGLLGSEDGGIYSARQAQINGKADLEATHLFRSLRGAQ